MYYSTLTGTPTKTRETGRGSDLRMQIRVGRQQYRRFEARHHCGQPQERCCHVNTPSIPVGSMNVLLGNSQSVVKVMW
jgi:hypothetical protein